MRTALAATLPALFGLACWNGGDAQGLPCRDDAQCGRGQSCDTNVCGGPSATTQPDTTSDTQADTDAVLPCAPPPEPMWCGEGTKVANRMRTFDEFARAELGNATSIVAGDFTSDSHIDVAVLSFSPHQLHMVSNEGEEFMLAGSLADAQITSTYDLLATDRDCNGTTEFLVLSIDGHITIANWNGTQFETTGGVDVGNGAFSMAVADLVEDDNHYPDLVVSGSDQVSLVRNVDGKFSQQGIATVGMADEFYEPWDTLVVRVGAEHRIVVPASDDRKHDGQRDMLVHLLTIAGTLDTPTIVKAMPPALQSDFRNPWSVAEGDFDGDGEREVAVAERNLNGESEYSSEPGRVRFFRVSFAQVNELVFMADIPGLATGVGPGQLAVADLDCDNRDDLVIGNSSAPEVGPPIPQILFGAEPLSSATLEDVTEATGVSPGSRMAVADFDEDGRPDVAIPDFGDPFGDPGERFVVIGVTEAE